MKNSIVCDGPGVAMARDHALDLGLVVTNQAGDFFAIAPDELECETLEAWKRWVTAEAVEVDWAHVAFGGEIPGDAYLAEHSWEPIVKAETHPSDEKPDVDPNHEKA